MFKKIRFRILGMIMSVATILIASMLIVIYIANSQYSYERGISLLENYVDNDNFIMTPNDGLNPIPPGKKNDHNKMFRLSTFYSVFYDTNGNADKLVLLPNFSCHHLRHTAATRLCEAGVNTRFIMDMLGHADIRTTMNIYVDVTKNFQKTEMEKFESYKNQN